MALYFRTEIPSLVAGANAGTRVRVEFVDRPWGRRRASVMSASAEDASMGLYFEEFMLDRPVTTRGAPR
jgi:hypothetical protein